MEIVLILDNIRSMYNVGSLFRTSDAFGVREIVCTGYTPTPEHPEMVKTSLGAEKTVAWRKEALRDAMLRLKGEGFTVVALETGGTSIVDAKIPGGKVALILGNETEGVTREALASADMKIEIPMRGQKESLNVSVTGAIALFHFSHL